MRKKYSIIFLVPVGAQTQMEVVAFLPAQMQTMRSGRDFLIFMQYNISPKKTKYNGRLYRSRLEAKWQSMFDKMGWKAEYEPSEINGYNPDFTINANSKDYPTSTIIVEIKPSVMIDEAFTQSVLKKYYDVPAHILILNDSPFYTYSYDYISIGVGSQWYGIDKRTAPEYWYEEDIFGVWKPNEPRSPMGHLIMKSINDFGSLDMLFDGMVFGGVERKRFITERNSEFTSLLRMWNEAGNDVMFEVKKYKNG